MFSRKFLDFGEFPTKILGNRAVSRKNMGLENRFYFVGYWKKKACSSYFSFQFMFILLFSDSRNDCQDQNYLFPLKILIKSFSFYKPLYVTVYPDLHTCSRIFSEGVQVTESFKNEMGVFTLSRESQFLGFLCL